MATLYVTPTANPTPAHCRRIVIPNDPRWLAAVNAAIYQLTMDFNWVQTDGMSPADAALYAADMFDNYINSGDFCMVGTVFASARQSLPDNALPCDGLGYNRVDYPELYAALSTAFIVDADHFRVPDLNGRVIVGVGAGAGLTNRNMADYGGEENHVLTVGELASHSHNDSGHAHGEGIAAPTLINGGLEAPASSSIPSVGVTDLGFASLDNTGFDSAHENMQPWSALVYGIWAK